MGVKLTDAIVKKLPLPTSGNRVTYDSEVKGFGCRVTAAGARAFVLNYRNRAGIDRRLTVGSFPEWGASSARNRASELKRAIDRGEDPLAEAREYREAPTVFDLAERYATEHLPRKAASSQKNDKQMIDQYIVPRLGNRKVAEVHDGDATALHREITAAGKPVRANRVLAVLSKMFSLALRKREGEDRAWRDHAQGNPCCGVERNPESGRERFFSEAEVDAIGAALDEWPEEVTADCLRLLMFTGCRPGEAMNATWQQMDALPGFWVKPAATVKQRKIHNLRLNAPALNIVARRRKARAKGDVYVFPGRKQGEPVKRLDKVWAFVKERAGIAAGRRYDLRHSFASFGAGRGIPLYTIGKLLGHSQARTTQRYAHLADDPLQKATADIGEAIAGVGKGDGAPRRLPIVDP
jgi:integrase